MENKAISKMNKKELYEKCQKQEQEIQKLSLFQEDREDVIKHNKNSFNELLRENEKLKEELEEMKKPSLNDAMGLTLQNIKNSKNHLVKMNKLKSDRDAKKMQQLKEEINELQKENKVLQMKYDKLLELF